MELVYIIGSILSDRNYAEKLFTHFNLKIQSYPFENFMFLSIEGCNIEFANINNKCQSKFHSHLSDDSRRDIYTTHIYIIYMLHEW